MTMIINGHRCDRCGTEVTGIMLPDSWEETYVPAPADEVWDGHSAEFCGRCSSD